MQKHTSLESLNRPLLKHLQSTSDNPVGGVNVTHRMRNLSLLSLDMKDGKPSS